MRGALVFIADDAGHAQCNDRNGSKAVIRFMAGMGGKWTLGAVQFAQLLASAPEVSRELKEPGLALYGPGFFLRDEHSVDDGNEW